MAKKIIMILSLFSNNRERKVFSYSCPDGRAVEGALSNEPSIKYLLEDDPAITEILCICSPEARSDSLDYFTDMIGSCYPDRITVTPIDYDDKKTSFENEPLKDILSHTSEGDEICLDTTGGICCLSQESFPTPAFPSEKWFIPSGIPMRSGTSLLSPECLIWWKACRICPPSEISAS